MNRGFSPSLVRPSLPLRRPATGPGSVSPRIIAPLFNDISPRLPQEQSLANGIIDAFKAEDDRKETGLTTSRDHDARSGPMSVMLKLCNYCSKQGSLRCTRCKKTCYCSVACQTEDWKAHRHICKPCVPDNSTSDKPHGAVVLESKVTSNDVVQSKRVFLRDLRSNSISSGDELQGTVVEMKNPGKFFIHIQSVEITQTLRNITLELQKVYGNSQAAEYKPEIGEICAAKFSLDQSWYRGEIISVDLACQKAKALYIDFGNEEDVTFDRLHPLAANIDAAPPCALQCRVAGVTAVTGTWSGECSTAVKRLVAGKTLTFSVVDSTNNSALLSVDAHLPALGKNLSRFLIDQGYAAKEGTLTESQAEQDITSLMTASFENFKRLSSGKNANTEAQPPEPLTQGVGDSFIAIVTHLQSPSEIICQKLENASVIQQLQMSLREHCTKTPSSEDFRPAPGTVCCSLFSEDNQWYRAKILAYSSEDRVCVGYIDFGNSEEVTLNHLRPINVDLLALATQAIPCSLAGVKSTSDTWSDEVVLMLKRLVCNRFIKVEILGQRDGMALVSMVDESSDPQTNIAEVLVANGYAAMGDMETKKETAEGVGSEGTVDAQAVDKLEWSCAELPIDGQKVVLVISVLENPGEFYCYNYNAEDMQILAELSSVLMKHCETASTPFSPTVGEPCCALYSGDSNWYRAMVQSVDGTGKATVCFVDYGNSCEVEMAHLTAIHPSMLKHPFQAIRCWLAGVEPVGVQWSKAAVQRFQALCVGKQLHGRVLSITERGFGVELECGDQSIAAALISEQLAQPLRQDAGVNARGAGARGPTPAALVPAKNPPLTEQLADAPAISAAPLPPNLASFALDWKTLVLPCNETFQPQVAAVVSPSLFYVMNPRKVNAEALQAVMMEVARYCSREPQASHGVPPPGAACCAQFTGDKNWYRAVVLDATSTHARVIYVDYGNVERVPVSSIVPISNELLQHPFQVARCALSGKEHFPTLWPPEVLELFSIQLSGKVHASVQSFDGVVNLLMLTQHTGQAGCNINSVILGALQKGPSRASADVLATDTRAPPRGSAPAGSAAEALGRASTADTGRTRHGLTEKKAPEISMENEQQPANGDSKGMSSAPSCACCCVDLKQKIDRVEELILLLLRQTGGTSKQTI